VDQLSRIPDVQIAPGGQHQLSIVSFNIDGVHTATMSAPYSTSTASP